MPSESFGLTVYEHFKLICQKRERCMSRHKFQQQHGCTSLDFAMCRFSSSVKRTSISQMFALLSLIDQLIDDIWKRVFGCMHCQTSKQLGNVRHLRGGKHSGALLPAWTNLSTPSYPSRYPMLQGHFVLPHTAVTQLCRLPLSCCRSCCTQKSFTHAGLQASAHARETCGRAVSTSWLDWHALAEDAPAMQFVEIGDSKNISLSTISIWQKMWFWACRIDEKPWQLLNTCNG